MKPFWYRVFFSTVGKPRKWVRRVVFRKDRTARPMFRRIVHKRSGAVRAHWAYWVASAPALLCLARLMCAGRTRWVLHVATETAPQLRHRIVPPDAVG